MAFALESEFANNLSSAVCSVMESSWQKTPKGYQDLCKQRDQESIRFLENLRGIVSVPPIFSVEQAATTRLYLS